MNIKYYENKFDYENLTAFQIQFLKYFCCLVELDEFEDADEIRENNAEEVSEAGVLSANLLKNNEIPENKLDVATPANPEQLRLEVN